jgi:hypothetical protein
LLNGKAQISATQAPRSYRILTALHFNKVRQESTHGQYERVADGAKPRAIVTVDDYDDFDESLIKRLIAQSTFTREQFYGATKNTAKKLR